MSNQDSFIDEVTEEVRKDRLFRLFKRYGWIGAVAIVLAVGGTAFNEWRKASAQAEAEAVGDAILAAVSTDSSERADALAAIEIGGNAGRAAVAALISATFAEDSGDVDEAITALETLAADVSAPQAFRDLASLKAVLLGGQAISAEDRIARMNSLVLGGGAFRLLAEEQIALAEIELGQNDAATARLRDILADASTTQDLRRRASQLIVALGGSLTES
ncbi:MAG: tetratricopeptide repeat protein [Boseongicola sp.]|nr:MAG: tetratricopeptide repeat protein [Boseongicola sp.]